MHFQREVGRVLPELEHYAAIWVDKDGDGKISDKEKKAAAEAMKRRRGGKPDGKDLKEKVKVLSQGRSQRKKSSW